jgi:hypothetical protein
MATYLPSFAYYVMSGTGIELILGAVYVISTVKTTVSSAKYAYSWVEWARRKERGQRQEGEADEAWQWIEDDEDEFIIEKDLS